jgi:hypothetical protein
MTGDPGPLPPTNELGAARWVTLPLGRLHGSPHNFLFPKTLGTIAS